MARFLEENAFDVLLIQDPPEAFRVGKGFVRGFDVILPSRAADVLPSPSEGPLTAIVARTSLHVQPIHFCHRRLCGVFVSTRRGPIAFISAYLQFSDGAGLEALPSLVSLARQKTSLVLIGADSNGHSRWWGPPTQVSNALGERVEDFIITEHFVVENEWPCPPTYTSDQGFTTWIDLTLASPRLSPSVTSWRVLDESSFDSDHSAVTFTISLTPVRVEEERLDWRHVRWDSFRSALSDILESRMPPLDPLQSSSDVEPFAQALATTLSDVVSHHVPTKRMSIYSQPWWSPHIDELHSAHNRARRRWRRTHSRDDKRVANECKRTLRRAIIDAKRSCWRQFCEDTSSADLWDAFRRIMRSRRATRIQDLVVDGEHISDEDGQAHAFADRFFPLSLWPPPVSTLRLSMRWRTSCRLPFLRTRLLSPVRNYTTPFMHPALGRPLALIVSPTFYSVSVRTFWPHTFFPSFRPPSSFAMSLRPGRRPLWWPFRNPGGTKRPQRAIARSA